MFTFSVRSFVAFSQSDMYDTCDSSASKMSYHYQFKKRVYHMSLNKLYYRLKIVQEDQRDIWDNFVTHHTAGHLLQCWAWGELKALSGWSPLRLALWQGDSIVAVAQVLRRGVPHLPLSLGHLAYVPKGPVLDPTQHELCGLFLLMLNIYLRKHGALALRMEPNLEAGTPLAEMMSDRLAHFHASPVHTVQPLRTIVLDLTPDEQALLNQMKEKWRYNVRLAMRKGVTIRVASSLDDVRAWYAIYQKTGERDQFGIHALDYYLQVWQLLVETGKMRLFLAEHDGVLLAGIFISLFAGQASYLYGASSNKQRQLMPNYLLQWEAICWAKQQGACLYDFWGIPDTDDEDEAMAGVYRFKRGWGGRVVQFLGGREVTYHPLLMRFARYISLS
jgi:peptidoglycan pentaglycine glycine transferase (the first glycine)